MRETWIREDPLSGWRTPMTLMGEGTIGLGGYPWMEFRRKFGPTELTHVVIANLPFRLSWDLREIQRAYHLHLEDKITWYFLYVTPGRGKRFENGTFDARIAYHNKTNTGGKHHQISHSFRNLRLVEEDLFEAFQDSVDDPSPGGTPWLCFIDFTIRLKVSGGERLIRVGTHRSYK